MSYQGNGSQANNLQTWDCHTSDPQSSDAVPYINRANRAVLARHQSSTSQINTTQNNEHRDSNYDYTQAESLCQSNPFTSNFASPAGQPRRASLPQSITHGEGIPKENQHQDSNTQTMHNFARISSNAIDPIPELLWLCRRVLNIRGGSDDCLLHRLTKNGHAGSTLSSHSLSVS